MRGRFFIQKNNISFIRQIKAQAHNERINSKYTSEQDRLRAVVEKLKEERAEHHTRYSQLRTEYDDKLHNSQLRYEELQTKYNEQLHLLKEKDAEITSLRQELSSVNHQLDSALLDVYHLQNEKKHLQEQVIQLEQEILQLQAQIAQYQAELSSAVIAYEEHRTHTEAVLDATVAQMAAIALHKQLLMQAVFDCAHLVSPSPTSSATTSCACIGSCSCLLPLPAITGVEDVDMPLQAHLAALPPLTARTTAAAPRDGPEVRRRRLACYSARLLTAERHDRAAERTRAAAALQARASEVCALQAAVAEERAARESAEAFYARLLREEKEEHEERLARMREWAGAVRSSLEHARASIERTQAVSARGDEDSSPLSFAAPSTPGKSGRKGKKNKSRFRALASPSRLALSPSKARSAAAADAPADCGTSLAASAREAALEDASAVCAVLVRDLGALCGAMQRERDAHGARVVELERLLARELLGRREAAERAEAEAALRAAQHEAERVHAEAALAAAQERLQRAEAAERMLQQQLCAQEGDLAARERALAELHAVSSEHERSLVAARTRVSELELAMRENIEHAAAAAREATAAVDALRQALHAAEQRVQEIEERLAGAEARARASEEEARTRGSELQRQAAASESVAAELAEATAELMAARDEVEGLRVRLATENAALRVGVFDAERGREREREEREEIARQLVRAEKQRAEAEAESARLHAELTRAREQAVAKEKELGALETARMATDAVNEERICALQARLSTAAAAAEERLERIQAMEAELASKLISLEAARALVAEMEREISDKAAASDAALVDKDRTLAQTVAAAAAEREAREADFAAREVALQDRVAELAAQLVAAVAAEAATKDALNTQACAEREEAAAALEQERAAVQRLQGELQEAVSALEAEHIRSAELAAAVDAKNTAMEAVRSECAHERTLVQALRAKLAVAEANMSTLRNEAAALAANNDRDRADAQAALTQACALAAVQREEELAALSREHESHLQEVVKTHVTRMQALEREVATVRGRWRAEMEEAQAEMESLRTALDAVRAEYEERLDVCGAHASARECALQSQLAELLVAQEEQRSTAEQELARAEQKVQAAATLAAEEVNMLRSGISEAMEELEQAQEALAAREQELAACRTELSALQVQVAAKEEEIAKNSSNGSRTQAGFDSMAGEHVRLLGLTMQLQEEQKRTGEELAALRKRLEDAEIAAEEHTRQLRMAEERAAQAATAEARAVAAITRERDELHARVAELQASVATAHEDAEDLRARVAGLLPSEVRAAELTQTCIELREELSAALEEVRMLQAVNDMLNEERAEAEESLERARGEYALATRTNTTQFAEELANARLALAAKDDELHALRNELAQLQSSAAISAGETAVAWADVDWAHVGADVLLAEDAVSDLQRTEERLRTCVGGLLDARTALEQQVLSLSAALDCAQADLSRAHDTHATQQVAVATHAAQCAEVVSLLRALAGEAASGDAAVVYASEDVEAVSLPADSPNGAPASAEAEMTSLVYRCQARVESLRKQCVALEQQRAEAAATAAAVERERDELLKEAQSRATPESVSAASGPSADGEVLLQLRAELDASKSKYKQVVLLLVEKEQQLGFERKKAAQAQEMLTQFESWRGSDLATLTRDLEEQLGASNVKLSEACAERDELLTEVRAEKAEAERLRDKLNKVTAALKILQSQSERAQAAACAAEDAGEAKGGLRGWFGRK